MPVVRSLAPLFILLGMAGGCGPIGAQPVADTTGASAQIGVAASDGCSGSESGVAVDWRGPVLQRRSGTGALRRRLRTGGRDVVIGAPLSIR